jgi:hypothetical protein
MQFTVIPHHRSQPPNDWRISCDRMSPTDAATTYRILSRNLLQYRPSEASAACACWVALRHAVYLGRHRSAICSTTRTTSA